MKYRNKERKKGKKRKMIRDGWKKEKKKNRGRKEKEKKK